MVVTSLEDRETYASQIIALEQAEWGDHGDEPEDIKEAYFDPAATMVLLLKDNKVIGFTCALPADYEDEGWIPEQIQGQKNIAYIQNTQIAPEYRRRKMVGLLMQRLEEALREKGYERLARDSAINNGYAQSIQKHYRDRIIRSFDHDSMYGPQRYFEIEL